MEDRENPIDHNTEELKDDVVLEMSAADTDLPDKEEGAETTDEDSAHHEGSPKAEQEDSENGLIQLKRFTEEDEDLNAATKTLRSILGGDFLTANFVRSQIFLILLIFGCFFGHITLRYVNQKELVEIDRLKKQLDDSRFNTLTRFSELTAKSRQTYIEEFLKEHSDSTLQTATQPPYIIHLNKQAGNFPSPTEQDSSKQYEVETSVEDGTIE